MERVQCRFVSGEQFITRSHWGGRGPIRLLSYRILLIYWARVNYSCLFFERVGSGQWGVGSGKWAVGNGQWGVGSGQWAVGSGPSATPLLPLHIPHCSFPLPTPHCPLATAHSPHTSIKIRRLHPVFRFLTLFPNDNDNDVGRHRVNTGIARLV